MKRRAQRRRKPTHPLAPPTGLTAADWARLRPQTGSATELVKHLIVTYPHYLGVAALTALGAALGQPLDLWPPLGPPR